jgi:uncharacterized protein
MTEILVRSAVPQGVDFGRREIDVLAVPYDSPAEVEDHEGVYTETIAAGAFGGVASRAARIKVLRDHHPHRVIGNCVRLDADRADGLHATLHISPIPLGDESLALAADGVLDVSVGISSQGGDRWNAGRTSVVRTNLRLWEISLVPLPAYENARVLAVRQLTDFPVEEHEPAGTPFLDEIRAWRLETMYFPKT